MIINYQWKFLRYMIHKNNYRKTTENGHREKTGFLDNSDVHHGSGIISTKDEIVKIMYLQFHAAPLIQPMDRGIIACFKRMYEKNC